CIPAVKIFTFLNLEPRLNNKNGFNWAGKIERFSKVSIGQPHSPSLLPYLFVIIKRIKVVKGRILSSYIGISDERIWMIFWIICSSSLEGKKC
ncbi:MAG: hypothetical protein PVH72_04965, partial [Desulfobacterales bacterium]